MVAPAFLHAKADIILRSCDGVGFRVITFFLTLASSSFNSFIEQAAQSDQIEDDLPIVSVEENHRVLDIWLRFCYPSTLVEDPPLFMRGKKKNLKGRIQLKPWSKLV